MYVAVVIRHLDLVPYRRLGFIRVLSAGGTMFDNHQYVSVVVVVALFVPVAVGDGFFSFLWRVVGAFFLAFLL